MAYALWLPGTLLGWLAYPSWDWSYRLMMGLALGTATVPLASFSAAWLLATSVTPPVVLGMATLLNAGAAALLWRRRRTVHGG